MSESPLIPQPHKRKDRLVGLIAQLRDGEIHRAQDLARQTGVVVRTIYRDMDTLMQSGVPITGTRGAGYQIAAQVTLPPLNLTMAELEALHLGLAVMTEASDADIRASARSVADKLDAALPEDGVSPTLAWGLAVHPFADTATGVRHIPAIRQAIRQRRKLQIALEGGNSLPTGTIIHPLKLEFWGRVWTITVWSEAKQGPLLLRVDWITRLTELDETYEFDEPD